MAACLKSNKQRWIQSVSNWKAIPGGEPLTGPLGAIRLPRWAWVFAKVGARRARHRRDHAHTQLTQYYLGTLLPTIPSFKI